MGVLEGRPGGRWILPADVSVDARPAADAEGSLCCSPLMTFDDHLLDLRLLLPTGSLKSNFEVVPSFQACPARLALEPWQVSARLALCVAPHAFAEDTPMARDEVFFVLRETFASVVSTVEVLTQAELHSLAYSLHFLFLSLILGH